MRSKKKLRTSLLFTLLFLGFMAAIDYPFVSRIINERSEGEVITGYESNAADIEEEQREAIRAKARIYNASLANGSASAISRPFADDTDTAADDQTNGNTTADDAAYQAHLNVGDDGVMGVIRIPRIGVSLPVYHGSEETELQKGAGHLEGTSLPVGGDSTHVGLCAHRGLPSKRMFTDLDQMKDGDIFFLDVLRETLAYQVREVQTVEPDCVELLAIQNGKDLVTLITCTPYGVNSQRLLVTGERIPYSEEIEAEAAKKDLTDWMRQYWWIALSVLLLLLLCVLLIQYNRRPAAKKAGRDEKEKDDEKT